MNFLRQFKLKKLNVTFQRFAEECNLDSDTITFYNYMTEDAVSYKYRDSHHLVYLFKFPVFERDNGMWIIGHFLDNGENICELSEDDTICLDPITGYVNIASYTLDDEVITKFDETIDIFINKLQNLQGFVN